MTNFKHILSVALVICYARLARADDQGRCSFMTAIPREPKPSDLPEIVWSGGWSDRPFIPAEEREDVCLDQYASGVQVIFMDEEIEGEVRIAKLNYNGNETPYVVTPLISGTFNLLGPEIRQVDGEWYLIITQRQDFETPGMQQYVFNVRIEGETFVPMISLRIVNIDDNDPIINVQSTCQVPELKEAHLTDCVYEVQDIDGEISTRFMTFVVTSERDDDMRIFNMRGTNRADTWFFMDMTVATNEALNFMSNALHIFQVTAYDSNSNSHTVTMMVQVENVEHRPPRWVEIFAVQQFDEKTEQTFTVRAIDGDTGINKPIHYRLETDPQDTFFSIETVEGGHDGGILKVQPIDRDALERELFQFKIIAYKPNNESLATVAEVAIIINDVNDQRPEPLFKEYHISILEETPLTLNFLEEFGFHDRDLGAHARYEVHLESDYPPEAEKAFYIAPDIGYQRQTFVMGTWNHSMLDYEDPPYQHIQLRVIATDLDNPNFIGVATVFIDLINWNDEQPMFQQSTQTVSFNETEGAGFFVANVLATDRDIGDRVEHSLMGNAGEYLSIDPDSGDIYVTIDNAFDYHRQNQLFVQVRADDTLMEPYHTTTTQLIIELEDVNNTPPTLRLPRGSPQVEENVPEGYEIANAVIHTITATDPDTTAYLQFEIDWDSSYATKQGRETDPNEFHGCVDIVTIFPTTTYTGLAIGALVVKEIRTNVTIDFEMFEVLYLTIRVRDLRTEIGVDYDESTLAITIIDMNDNAPEWVEGTLTQNFRVRETSASDTVIGSVVAIDIDGPLYNQVRYTIFPREDTPENLVKIDFQSGQITVDAHGAIDADVPPRHYLYYTVIASDRCFLDEADCPSDPTFWDTKGEIQIEIIDINNKIPEADTTKFETRVEIYENATTGDDVLYLFSIDLDRDEIYHTVSYQIDYAANPRLRDFFAVDRETGRVFVDYTTDDVLDRDGDEPTHRIIFRLLDNFLAEGDGNINQNSTEVLVVLLDVNDNAPELPTPQELSWSISEGLTSGTLILPIIYAPDRDEPGTDNSRVGYEILSLTITNRNIEVPDLFKINLIEADEEFGERGQLETALHLRSYWGTYDIHILAYDHGIPQQSSNETYTLVINPYNFHAPEFEFPAHGTVVRLAREWAIPGVILRKVNNENLDTIIATDEDGLEAGVVTFSITGDAEAEEYFDIINNNNNMGTLQLKKEITDQIEFNVQIRATDGGTDPGPLFTYSTLYVVFVPTTGNPVFAVDTHTVAFFEKDVGLTESFNLPNASDPKNYLCSDDCHAIYYSIFDGNDDDHFRLDATTNTLSLVKQLDREESQTHRLTVVASNFPDTAVPVAGATLTVIVNVREADPRPYFEQQLYTAGISTSDSVGRELLTIHATHSENAVITYSIDESSMVVDPSLEVVKDYAFSLNPESGVLLLNVQPTAAMQGIFEFDVIATDPANEKDIAEVKVYVVSAQNRVFFVFLNTVSQIEANRNFIAETFTSRFEMTCNIDQVTPFTDENGIASNTSTRLQAHFIRDDIPVTADVVETIRSDTETILAVRESLLSRQVVLQDVFTDESPELASDNNQLMVYVLAGLTAVLAVMIVLLYLTFIIRVRYLNKRLESLSTNKYGSIDSGLNRAGLIAPGTNKHAVEGSNPIWNETIKAPDFDAISEFSGDSDLVGIEDLPQFQKDYYPPEDIVSFGDILTDRPNSDPVNKHLGSDPQVANHSNNFGFKAPTFKTFGNSNQSE